MTKDEYSRYLKSPEWQERRALAITRTNGKCQDCLDEGGWRGGASNEVSVPYAEQVHHLTYDRVGRELPGDLVALCERYHNARHGISGQNLSVTRRAKSPRRVRSWMPFAKGDL